jgi:hypothetical protein
MRKSSIFFLILLYLCEIYLEQGGLPLYESPKLKIYNVDYYEFEEYK